MSELRLRRFCFRQESKWYKLTVTGYTAAGGRVISPKAAVAIARALNALAACSTAMCSSIAGTAVSPAAPACTVKKKSTSDSKCSFRQLRKGWELTVTAYSATRGRVIAASAAAPIASALLVLEAGSAASW